MSMGLQQKLSYMISGHDQGQPGDGIPVPWQYFSCGAEMLVDWRLFRGRALVGAMVHGWVSDVPSLVDGLVVELFARCLHDSFQAHPMLACKQASPHPQYQEYYLAIALIHNRKATGSRRQ